MPRGSILSTLRLRHIRLRAHFRSHPEYYAKEYLSRNQKPIIMDGGGKYLSRGNKTISIRSRRSGSYYWLLRILIRRKLRLTRRPMPKLSCMVKSTLNSGFMQSKGLTQQRLNDRMNVPKAVFLLCVNKARGPGKN